MPLVSSTLKNSLQTMFEDAENGVEITPSDWVDAIVGYFGQATFPIAGGTQLSTAEGTFLSTIQGAWGTETVGVALQSGLIAFQITIALDISPTSGYPSIPPTVPPILVPAFAIGIAGGSSSAVATSLASIIHLSFITGVYQSGTSVSPVPTPWS